LLFQETVVVAAEIEAVEVTGAAEVASPSEETQARGQDASSAERKATFRVNVLTRYLT
jgi:hypothetical protein